MSTTQWSLERLKRARAAVAAWVTADRRRTVVAGGGLLVLIALGLGIAFGLEVTTLAVVVYGTVFAGVTMLGITPLRALPALDVGLWVDGELAPSFTRRSDRPRGPIDIDACVRNVLATIHAQIPAAATPGLRLKDADYRKETTSSVILTLSS